jgi:hypothetical protein
MAQQLRVQKHINVIISIKKLKSMKKKVRKMSDAQKVRILNTNGKVFWRLNKALAVINHVVTDSEAIDKLPLFALAPAPMSFVNFGAYMANTKTHKRNNK